jgi:hypothetical protein
MFCEVKIFLHNDVTSVALKIFQVVIVETHIKVVTNYVSEGTTFQFVSTPIILVNVHFARYLRHITPDS